MKPDWPRLLMRVCAEGNACTWRNWAFWIVRCGRQLARRLDLCCAKAGDPRRARRFRWRSRSHGTQGAPNRCSCARSARRAIRSSVWAHRRRCSSAGRSQREALAELTCRGSIAKKLTAAQEIERRRHSSRVVPWTSQAGRIVVDDGIATGGTVRRLSGLAKARPARLVQRPVAPPDTLERCERKPTRWSAS
jgi:hypothetical protein